MISGYPRIQIADFLIRSGFVYFTGSLLCRELEKNFVPLGLKIKINISHFGMTRRNHMATINLRQQSTSKERYNQSENITEDKENITTRNKTSRRLMNKFKKATNPGRT